MEYDTIAAISTPIGEGGIAIVRLSGIDSLKIVDKLYQGKRSLHDVPSHTISYGHLYDNQTIVDEVLVTVMRAPNTFTRENVVEINCHGGLIPAKRVLDLILANGASLAEPGEFTKRAFLNGRIDLSQAEAVMDLIRSKTDRAMSFAMRQVEGELSAAIKLIRQKLLEALAHIEVNIDYPEHDVETITRSFLQNHADSVKEGIVKLLVNSQQGKILREGLSTVIIGRPNVGKSSLLNKLIRENKAIVTDIPGTTRDVIEEYISIRGIPLKLVDTAGIRDTEDIIEKIGVEKSRKALGSADLVLLVLNHSEELSADDLQLIELVKGLNVIVVINKTDLPKRLDIDLIIDRLSNKKVILTSITHDKGIDELEEGISDLFFSGHLQGDDLASVSNSRHIALLHNAKNSIEEAIDSIRDGQPIDLVAIDLKNTWELLGEIIGEAVSEDLTNQIFSQFCVGK